MKAIQIEEFGGPEVLRHVEVDDPVAGEGEVVVEVARSGINFADTHATRNDYLAEQQLPLIPGAEVSGRTPDGRRVAAILASGGYAEKVVVPESWLVPIPDEVDDDQAAALLLQGLTAMALVAALRPARARRDDRDRGRRRRHRRPLGAARQAGRREGDRPRLQRGEAGAGRAARRRRHRRLPLRGPEGGDPRGQRRRAGRRRPPHERRRRLRRRVLGAGAARADGRLRDRLARAARGLDRGPAARLEGRDRLLARPPAARAATWSRR